MFNGVSYLEYTIFETKLARDSAYGRNGAHGPPLPPDTPNSTKPIPNLDNGVEEDVGRGNRVMPRGCPPVTVVLGGVCLDERITACVLRKESRRTGDSLSSMLTGYCTVVAVVDTRTSYYN